MTLTACSETYSCVPSRWRFRRGTSASEIGDEVVACRRGDPSTGETSNRYHGRHDWGTPVILSKSCSHVWLHTRQNITDVGWPNTSSSLLRGVEALLSLWAPIKYLALADVLTAVDQGYVAMICGQRLPKQSVFLSRHGNGGDSRGTAGRFKFVAASKQSVRCVCVDVSSGATFARYKGLSRPLYGQVVEGMKEAVILPSLRDALSIGFMSRGVQLAEARMAIEAEA